MATKDERAVEPTPASARPTPPRIPRAAAGTRTLPPEQNTLGTVVRAPSSVPPPLPRAVTHPAPAVARTRTETGSTPAIPRTPALPAIGRTPTRTGAAPAIPRPPALPVVAPPEAPIVGRTPTERGPAIGRTPAIAVGSTVIPVLPAAPTFTTLPPAIAAAVSALPPYVPAPNLGDPGEAIATIPIERFELAELVPQPTLPIELIEESPAVAIPAPPAAKRRSLAWVAPVVGGIALVLPFVIGFVVFDGEGRQAMTTVKAPAPRVEPAAIERPVAKPIAKPVAKPVEKPIEEPLPKPVAPPPPEAPAVPAAAAAPPPVTRPARAIGRIYIRTNRPAQIFLDGKSVSATTPRQLRVSPGTHKVTLRDATTGKTVTQVIDVPANEVVTVSKKFD